jgi:YcaO-like protein with predicted kinase domain
MASIPAGAGEAYACGNGPSRRTALGAMLMEAYEYRVRFGDADRIQPARPVAEMTGRGRLTLGELNAIRPPTRRAPYRPTTMLDWAPALDVTPGGAREVWIPADFVTCRHPSGPGVSRSIPSRNSSGMAAGPDVVGALCRGLLEWIERDAWVLSNFAPHRSVDLAASSLAAPVAAAIERLHSSGVRPFAFAMTTDVGIPSYEVYLLQDAPGGGAFVTPGLGCHPIDSVALGKAVCEAVQTRVMAFSGLREDIRETRSARSEAAAIERAHARAARHGTVRATPPPARPPAAGELLARVLDALWAVGVPRILVHDLSLPDAPAHCLNTFVPGLENYTYRDARGSIRLGPRGASAARRSAAPRFAY